MSRGRWGLASMIAAMLVLAGCAPLGYYWQSASGHLALLHAARPMAEVMDDPSASEALRTRLALAQRMRRFAVTELGLPDNRSYTTYANLQRSAAVWNVVAALPYSLTLKTWCFPVAGCVGYRGYYREADAQAEAQTLRDQGLEAAVYPVPAYSTLGWSNWLGGDPLLSTFIGYPEGELARIVFHELAHQVVYVAGDTTFNESYASAVEKLGSAQWLATQADEAARQSYALLDAQRRGFRELTLHTRERLQAIYAQTSLDAAEMQRKKQQAMEDFHARYAALRATWSGPRQRAYDTWVERANNALFGTQAAYDALEPAFEALFERERQAGEPAQAWPRFHAAVRALAQEPAAQRAHRLRALLPTPTVPTDESALE